ncbi:MAG: Hsp20/alpha crystallin family protein [Rhodospirillales bacterium]|nr:Hsp20/alpha crystallin family protein [Rhodospirillales bacterium]
MAKTEMARAPETTVGRPRDIFSAMRGEMDRMFERFEHGLPRFPHLFRADKGSVMLPELDVRENATTITVEAELPGVEEKDISVTLSNGILSIKGEKKQDKEEKAENYYLAERSYGAFERSLQLPDSVDETKVDAKFDNGVLKITATKRPEAVKAQRKIEIRTAS